MATFYVPSSQEGGESVVFRPGSRDEFIACYADMYYCGGTPVVPDAKPNSRYVEDEIDALLKRGIQTTTDVTHILAWKFGKIDHGGSDRNESFCYREDWKNAEDLKDASYWGHSFDLESVATFIVDNIVSLEEMAKDDPQGVLDRLKNFKWIGPVHTIALLYFISRGRYPIYDEFAKRGLDAIVSGVEPGVTVAYVAPPDKTSKKFDTVVEDVLNPFTSDLDAVFSDAWRESRDVDRALWVYGHLFK